MAAETVDTCAWWPSDESDEWDGSAFETTCQHTFEFTADGIQENDFVFCPFCGKRIEEPRRG